MSGQLTVVVSKDRGHGAAQREVHAQLAAALARMSDVAVAVVPHLYDLASDGPAFEMLRAVPGDVAVLSWLYPRAAYWVLDANGVRGRMGRSKLVPEEEVDEPRTPRRRAEAPDRTIWCLDLRAGHEAQVYVEEVARLAGVPAPAIPAGGPPRQASRAPAEVEEPAAPRWYPVIDFSRCANCLECLNFCLFGVFGLDESDAVVVESPDACRPGCPACARVCPSGAIMFPQHSDAAIAGNGAGAAQGPGAELFQLVTPGDLQARAGAERQRAIEEQERHTSGGAEAGHSPAPGKGDLDRLVDEVDDLEM